MLLLLRILLVLLLHDFELFHEGFEGLSREKRSGISFQVINQRNDLAGKLLAKQLGMIRFLLLFLLLE